MFKTLMLLDIDYKVTRRKFKKFRNEYFPSCVFHRFHRSVSSELHHVGPLYFRTDPNNCYHCSYEKQRLDNSNDNRAAGYRFYCRISSTGSIWKAFLLIWMFLTYIKYLFHYKVRWSKIIRHFSLIAVLLLFPATLKAWKHQSELKLEICRLFDLKM